MSEKRFRVEEFSSVSTLEMAWERYPFMEKSEEIQGTVEPTQPNFCRLVARTNDLALLKWAREVKRCRWDWRTPSEAAEAGNLEMLKYCFEGYRNEDDFGPAPGDFDGSRIMRRRCEGWVLGVSSIPSRRKVHPFEHSRLQTSVEV